MSSAKVAIVFHSFWGHIATLAEEAAAGAKAAGVTVDIYTFPETLSDEVLGKLHAVKELGTKYPPITADLLAKYDGFIFAFGTRFGRAPAQVSTFFDTTGGLWATGALVGKFGSLITSTAGQNGGHETTHLTTLPWLVHHGVTYVPIGYQFPELSRTDEVHGGSPYGASTLSKSDGSRQVNADEKSIARKQGEYFAKTVATFVKGKSL